MIKWKWNFFTIINSKTFYSGVLVRICGSDVLLSSFQPQFHNSFLPDLKIGQIFSEHKLEWFILGTSLSYAFGLQQTNLLRLQGRPPPISFLEKTHKTDCKYFILQVSFRTLGFFSTWTSFKVAERHSAHGIRRGFSTKVWASTLDAGSTWLDTRILQTDCLFNFITKPPFQSFCHFF